MTMQLGQRTRVQIPCPRHARQQVGLWGRADGGGGAGSRGSGRGAPDGAPPTLRPPTPQAGSPVAVGRNQRRHRRGSRSARGTTGRPRAHLPRSRGSCRRQQDGNGARAASGRAGGSMVKSVWARRPRALESLCLHNQGQRLCMSGGPGPLPTGPAPGKQWARPRSSRRPRRGVPGPRGPHLCLGGHMSPCKAFTTLTESGGRGRGDVLSGLSHSSRSWSGTWGPGRTSEPCAAPHPGAGCRLCGCPGRPSRWVSPPRRHAGRRCCMGGLLTLPTRWRGLLCRRPRPGLARPGCSPAAPRAGSRHPPLMDPGSWCRAGFTGLTEMQCACWELWALPGCSSGAGAAQLPGMPEAARASRAQQARCWKRPRAQGKGRIRKGGEPATPVRGSWPSFWPVQGRGCWKLSAPSAEWSSAILPHALAFLPPRCPLGDVWPAAWQPLCRPQPPTPAPPGSLPGRPRAGLAPSLVPPQLPARSRLY